MSELKPLESFEPKHDFLVGIDSDGCVFDSMEIKQKECFCPAFIKAFGLQPVSKYAREVWEFVNLYSKTRGCNRFPAIADALDYLRDRSEVRARDVVIPETGALREWIGRESTLGNATLEAEIAGGNREMEIFMTYSLDANERVADIVKGVPPFPLVREVLAKMTEQADLIVVSQTPHEALVREWSEHGIDGPIQLIAGQELGTKTEHIQRVSNGRYAPDRILVIGDAPGDMKAAKANDALFYPILPGAEEASWKRLFEEGVDRFFAGRYAGAYETERIADFDRCLPERAPWLD